MANNYDKIFRENIAELFPSLSKRYLGIEIAQSELLNVKLQKTVGREADFVQKVVTTQGEKLIIHLEFQSTNDPQMLQRMQLYHALLSQDYDWPIRQFVIYMGAQPANMKSKPDARKIFSGFELVDLHHFDTDLLLKAHLPEEVILAILSDFEADEAISIVPQIIQRLKGLSTDEATLKKYTYQLLTLARLRNLTDITQQIINNMAFNYDIEKDALYKRGLETGLTKGLELGEKTGEEIGLVKGEERGTIKTAIRMKKAGFSTEDIVKATGLSAKQINNLPIDE